jgi:hypothetical protein
MKNLKNILIMVLSLLLFSCEETTMPLFDAQYSFVSITDGSYSISKSSSEILEIPVVIAGIEGTDISVTFTVEETGDNPAKEGVDYEVVNIDKKVIVGKGAGTGFVQIKPLDSKDAVGDKTFKVKLVSNSANLYIAVDADSVVAKIREGNNSMELFVGKYEENDYLLDKSGVEGPYEITIDVDSENDNMLIISNFWGGEKDIKARVNMETNTIEILAGQTIYIDKNHGDCTAIAIDIEAGDIDKKASIIGSWTDDGTITFGAWTAYDIDENGAYGVYEKTVLTKK